MCPNDTRYRLPVKPQASLFVKSFPRKSPESPETLEKQGSIYFRFCFGLDRHRTEVSIFAVQDNATTEDRLARILLSVFLLSVFPVGATADLQAEYLAGRTAMIVDASFRVVVALDNRAQFVFGIQHC